MFCLSSSDTASVCSRYCCSACSLASTCLRCSPSRSPEPVRRFLRRHELELEVLLDVRLAPARWRPAPPAPASGDSNVTSTSRLLRIGRDRQAAEEPVDRAPTALLVSSAAGLPAARRLGLEPARHRARPARRRSCRTDQPARALGLNCGCSQSFSCVERPAGQGAALQDLVLRLVVVVRDLVLLEHFLEADDVRRSPSRSGSATFAS